MKRWLLLFAAAVCPASVFAQAQRIDNYALINTGSFVKVLAGAIVTVCTSAGTGTPCTPLATTYTSITLGTPTTNTTPGLAQACGQTPATNPCLTDANGNFGFWVTPGPVYIVTVTGSGVTAATYTITSTLNGTGNNTFSGNNIHSGTETFNNTVTETAAVNETATHALSNAGVFTNTQFNEYLTSSINGCSSGAQYRLNPINPNTPFVTEALTGCVTVPVGATVVQANGISGFVNTSSTVTNAVGVYGQARAGANNVTMWGANFVTDDCPGGYTLLVCNSVATNTGGSGIEIDVNANSTTTKVQGLTITGLWSAQPSGLANAIRIHALEQGGACTTCSWNGGLVFDAGATVGGLNSPGIFLPVAALSGVNVQSQTIRLESNDPVAGQNEAQLFENAVGNVAFTTSKANATAILNGNAFLNRVTAASTTQPGGVQTQRVAAGCATGAAVGAACTTTVSWPVQFGDSLYTPTCNGFGITSGVPVNGGITAVANASVTFQTVATTAAAAQYTNISCTAIHD